MSGRCCGIVDVSIASGMLIISCFAKRDGIRDLSVIRRRGAVRATSSRNDNDSSSGCLFFFEKIKQFLLLEDMPRAGNIRPWRIQTLNTKIQNFSSARRYRSHYLASNICRAIRECWTTAVTPYPTAYISIY
jgi:hypothetical protein